jgi:hypothetical protein
MSWPEEVTTFPRMTTTEKFYGIWLVVLTLAFGYLLYRGTKANDRWEQSMDRYEQGEITSAVESQAISDSVRTKIDELNKAIDRVNNLLGNKP